MSLIERGFIGWISTEVGCCRGARSTVLSNPKLSWAQEGTRKPQIQKRGCPFLPGGVVSWWQRLLARPSQDRWVGARLRLTEPG